MKMFTKSALIVGAAITALVMCVGGGATAGSLITSAQIKNHTIKQKDLAPSVVAKLDAAAPGTSGSPGAPGTAGAQGLAGAYYSVAQYRNGVNAGAVASVACKNVTDVAISGGVQVTGLNADPLSGNTPVSSSFPGRMDYSTNTPKPNRLDGWIVQFGGNAGATSDASPNNVNVFALCVPNAPIKSEVTYTTG